MMSQALCITSRRAEHNRHLTRARLAHHERGGCNQRLRGPDLRLGSSFAVFFAYDGWAEAQMPPDRENNVVSSPSLAGDPFIEAPPVALTDTCHLDTCFRERRCRIVCDYVVCVDRGTKVGKQVKNSSRVKG